MYKPRHYGTSKDAATRLIEACGGLTRAAGFARVSRSQLARYTDPQSPDEIPVDVVATLEAVAKAHPVTEWLAALGGLALVPTLSAPTDSAIARDIARLGQEIAELMQAFAEGIADGAIDPAEARRMMREADDGIRALATLRAHCHAIADEGER